MADAGKIISITARFTNFFNKVDLTIDRTFYAGNYFAFTPWVGLVSAWERQRFDLDGVLDSADVPPGIFQNFSYYNYGTFGNYAMQGLTAKLRLNF